MRTAGKLTYHCETCNTGYDKAKDAENCEKRTKERSHFKKGDAVTMISYKMVCNIVRPSCAFLATGKIVKITRLRLQDQEYANKWLSALTDDITRRINKMHVRMYEVAFKCVCGEKRFALVYAPELKLVKSR